MEKVILLLHLCLPSDGTIECVFAKEEMQNQTMCEQRVEQLQYQFSDIKADVFNLKCEENKNDII